MVSEACCGGVTVMCYWCVIGYIIVVFLWFHCCFYYGVIMVGVTIMCYWRCYYGVLLAVLS